MPENWKTYNLEEILQIKNGKTKPKNLGDIPIYGGNGILGFGNKSNLSQEAVLIGRVGAYCGAVYFENREIWVSDNSLYGIAKTGFDTRFVYYLLKWANLNRYSTGSSQPLLTQGALNCLEFRIPETFQEQKSIASILSALDDKIELNLQMNKTLEEMAMALYKHWFVDFGPFQDGEFVASELGEIPKGWEVKSINEFGKVVCGKTPSKKDPDNFTQIGGYPFIKIPEMHGNVFLIETVERVSEKGNQKQAKKLLPSGCINVSCIATVGLVTINAFPSHTNQQINSIIPVKETYRYYLYSTMISLKERFLNEASGGSATLNMNTSTFSNIKILKPDEETLQKFSKLTTSTFSKILQNQEENQTLTQLRDTLLPKLISGEVRVKDAEKTLSEIL